MAGQSTRYNVTHVQERGPLSPLLNTRSRESQFNVRYLTMVITDTLQSKYFLLCKPHKHIPPEHQSYLYAQSPVHKKAEKCNQRCALRHHPLQMHSRLILPYIGNDRLHPALLLPSGDVHPRRVHFHFDRPLEDKHPQVLRFRMLTPNVPWSENVSSRSVYADGTATQPPQNQ